MRGVTKDQLAAADAIHSLCPEMAFGRGTLEGYFHQNPLNSDPATVSAKVALVDGLFNTMLWRRRRRWAMRNHILALSRRGLDEQLSQGDVLAVTGIEDLGEGRLESSFASKYAHFHNSKAFPILDSRTKDALGKLTGKRIDSSSCAPFFEEVHRWKESQEDLRGVGFDAVDKFLWLYGQALKKEWQGAELKELAETEKGKQLLRRLAPSKES